ncbi:MAG: hypothetical protein SPM09_01790 [Fibrobacter sp.]|uniref:hypothetical protein n=1 Tax=Fibrobacter sp. TaxID=35828 RepID=UPI002A914633|nr:hypothetical protein [Fibrobacter sp.]MDY6263117.1 hypothetical protein [Fibrobacter sp.]
MQFPFRVPDKPGRIFRYKHGSNTDQIHPFVYLGTIDGEVVVASFVTSQQWHESTPENLFVKFEPETENVVIDRTSYILVREVHRFPISKMKADYSKDDRLYKYTTESVSEKILSELITKIMNDETVDDDVKQLVSEFSK